MSSNRIVVIGTSAGGIEVLRAVMGALPADFPAPIAAVTHLAPQSPGLLDGILDRAGPLRAVNPRDGERLRGGTIYVAPPDRHLLLEPGRIRVTKGPRENRFRPAIDPLFRSAAQVFGPAAIGVILTGNLDDGVAGLWAIKQLGGTTIVQDPADAMFPSLPHNALAHVAVDYTVPLGEIAPLLVRLLAAGVQPAAAREVSSVMEMEVKIGKEETPLAAGLANVAQPSTIACPDCHGVLFKIVGNGPIRFRCHTGHAYSIESLLAAVDEGIDGALWNATRALEEGMLLLKQMSDHVRGTHGGGDVDRLARRAEEARAQSRALRQMIITRSAVTGDER